MIDPAARARPWLSVLIPVYNVAPWLDDCLRSVLGQADDGVEVLLLDDASTDGSLYLALDWQARHPGRLRVLRHPANRGLSAARNTLVEAASGDYVWFLDSDDRLHPGAIARLRDTVADGGPDLVLCDFSVLRPQPRLKHRLRGERHRSTFHAPGDERDALSALVAGVMLGRQLHAWSKIARRELWRQARFPEGRCFEDIAALPALLTQVRRWCHVAEPWVAYRQRPGSILSSLTPARARDFAAALTGLARFLDVQGPGLSPRARFAVKHFCLRSSRSLVARLRRAPWPEREALLAELDASLRLAIPEGRHWMLRQYLRRGWWGRAARLAWARRDWTRTARSEAPAT